VGCTSVILVLALTSLLTCDDKNSRVFAEEAGTAVSVSCYDVSYGATLKEYYWFKDYIITINIK
jgi:hypothetical protein